jgi:hypothetical protein
MKMQTAVIKMAQCGDEESSHLWARPVTWRGSGAAVTLNSEGMLVTVNSPESDFYFPYDYEVVDDWEIVTSETLLKEMWKNAKV